MTDQPGLGLPVHGHHARFSRRSRQSLYVLESPDRLRHDGGCYFGQHHRLGGVAVVGCQPHRRTQQLLRKHGWGWRGGVHSYIRIEYLKINVYSWHPRAKLHVSACVCPCRLHAGHAVCFLYSHRLDSLCLVISLEVTPLGQTPGRVGNHVRLFSLSNVVNPQSKGTGSPT